MTLPQEFYLTPNVLDTSQKLLGKYLFTHIENKLTGGMITEVEAYAGPEDKASHAYQNRRTPRNEVMFSSGGVAYVYICYGMHVLFNVVTNRANIPHAILIRSILPMEGISFMQERRKKEFIDKSLTLGPGNLSKALGITRTLNGESLTGSTLWIEDKGVCVEKNNIVSTPRIGIDYAQEYIHVPWRFVLKHD